MPSANTKPVATRISKDLYWGLLKEAAEHQRTISKHLEAVLEEYLRKKKVPSKAEKGAIISTTKKTKCIAFQDFPDIIIQKIDGKKWSMHTIRPDNKVSKGTFGRQIANGSIVFDGYDISFGNDSKFHCKGHILKFYETELEIEWYD